MDFHHAWYCDRSPFCELRQRFAGDHILEMRRFLMRRDCAFIFEQLIEEKF